MKKKEFESKEEAQEYIEKTQMTDSEIDARSRKVDVAPVMPKMVQIEFRNERDGNKTPLTFHYHSKTHPLKHYTLFHGYKYDLPVEVVEHLESCRIAQYENKIVEDSDRHLPGSVVPKVTSYKYMFHCKPVR